MRNYYVVEWSGVGHIRLTAGCYAVSYGEPLWDGP